MMKRRNLCGLAAVLCLAAFCAGRATAAAEKPNIILCMTDDQGWGDTSYNGHPELKTPELDKMAAADVLMSEALGWIGKQAEAKKPFLAVIWFPSPHGPHQATPEYAKPYEKFGKAKANYYGELAGVDHAMGTLRKSLREMKIADNTMLTTIKLRKATVAVLAGVCLAAFGADGSDRMPTDVEAAANDALPDRHRVTIPVIDLTGETNRADLNRHVVLSQGTAADDWQHPHMLLMPDGKTIFATWTRGHGGTCGYLKRSDDGGRTWSQLLEVPDNWMYAVSDDEGETWSKPKELPAALTGDRHAAVDAKDGRLVVMLRDRRPVPKSEANHDKGGQSVWGSGKTTVWVGRYEDIPTGREGQYLMRVLGYGGYGKLECLPDGSILGLTYCRYPDDSRNLSSIVTTRFKLEETDALLRAKRQLVAPGGVSRPAGEGKEEDLQLRKEQARQSFDYQNPIRSQAIDGGIRDPHIINWDGKYYLTGTSYPFTRGNRTGVRLWSSDDLKNWKMEGILIDSSKLPEDVWYRDTFWANEIHIGKGKFWLTFNAANMSAEHKAQHSCGLAVADKITGPYTVLTTRKSLLDGKHVHQTSHPTQP